MSGRALTFGRAAKDYERFRPDYPVELVEAVEGFSRSPVRSALEIGAGTGKATRLFSERGIAVTATEPDAQMLAELRAHVPATVRTVRACLEDLQPAETYDLVYAAAALHWTQPEGRWERISSLLKPDGVFASFGGPFRVADPSVAEAVRAARQPILPNDDVPSPDGTPPDERLQWPGTELQRSGRFTDVQQSVVERRLTITASEYIGYLSTVSAYLMLSEPERRLVFERIRRVLPKRVDIAADITVHLARRR